MKITGMLAWWDEPPELLDGCIRSLGNLCDTVIAVDGAYVMTPGATPSSPTEQAEAIREAATETGIKATIVRGRLWAGQVEKRNFMLEKAAKTADWLLAVDADHRLVCNRERIRAELARIGTSAESILHDFATPVPEGVEVEVVSPHEWHTDTAGKIVEHSLLFRRLDDMHVEECHWGYTGLREDGERVGLGMWKKRGLGRHVRLSCIFGIDHVCFSRDQMRLDRNRDYSATRDEFAAVNGYEP